jgi:hypothetical protein
MPQSDKKLLNKIKNMTGLRQASKPAFASLLGVIILSVAVVSVIFTGSIISIDNNRFNRVANDAIIANRSAYSCAEIALNKLKTDLNYTGNEAINLDGITCNILTISGIGNSNRVLKVSAVTTTAVVKKIQISVQTVNPSYIFTSWQEVADFY